MPDPDLSTRTLVDPFSRRPPRRRLAERLGPVAAVAAGILHVSGQAVGARRVQQAADD